MKSRKLLALLTVLALTLSLFTVSALADEAPAPAADEPMLIAEAPDADAVAATQEAADTAANIAAMFTDAASIKNTDAVAALVSLGIIAGVEQADGTFVYAPQQSITREQMAKMIAMGYSMYSGKAVGTATSKFADVSGRWSESYVAYCAANGIINGRSDTEFDYAGSVTVTETAKLIMAAAGVEGLTGDSWKTATLAAANAIGLLEGVESGADDPITRDEAALVLSKAVTYLSQVYAPKVSITEAGKAVANVMVSTLSKMTSFRMRNDEGSIYLGYYVNDGAIDKMSNLSGTDAASIAFDVTAEGPGFTALYASGEKSVVTATGKLKLTDTGDGTDASDFSGVGTAIVAANDAKVTVDGMTIETDGFMRDAFIVDEGADLVVKASTVVTMGANPLTETYKDYFNSANQDKMLSPPWVLGIQGGVRSANVLGDYASLTVVNSTITSGGWAVLSTDACTEPVLNIMDSTLAIVPESEGGMDSGDFAYSAKYGSGYGTYSIGFATENFFGATITGATYGTILRSGYINYKSSNGKLELKNVAGDVVYSGEGKGNPTTINTVFGVLTHSGEAAVVNASEGTVFNTEEAAFLYKTSSTATFNVDNCKINSASGVILQMIDDDDSSVGIDMSTMGFKTSFAEAEGWPSANGSVSGKAGGDKVYLNLTNGDYTGSSYNGTGYYNQGGDNMYVTVGEGATLTGAVSLTETQHLVKNFTINEYYNLGHVANQNYWNGVSTAEVTVKAGSTWTVTAESLLTKLTVEEGAIVKGVMTVNADGTITVAPSETETVAAGSYGTIEAQAAAAGGMKK